MLTYCTRRGVLVASSPRDLTLINMVLFDKPYYKSLGTLNDDNVIVNTDNNTIRSDTIYKWDEIYDSVLITDKSTPVDNGLVMTCSLHTVM